MPASHLRLVEPSSPESPAPAPGSSVSPSLDAVRMELAETPSAGTPPYPGGRLQDAPPRRGSARSRLGTPIVHLPTVREQRPQALRWDVEVEARPLERRATADFQPRRRSELASRLLNVTVAAIALVLLAPVMLLVALAVKLTSPGPVLYQQTRVGLDRRRRDDADALGDRRATDFGGRMFTIYKFRSMRTDAEREGAVWATQNDPRVTPVGKVIRALRLDELPQLLNVIKGDMNIVGPRPERPSIFVKLREDIEGYPLRQLARPGITGWAQVNLTYDTCIDDVRTKVRYDLEYLQRQGFVEDIRIMARTVPVMLFRQSGW